MFYLKKMDHSTVILFIQIFILLVFTNVQRCMSIKFRNRTQKICLNICVNSFNTHLTVGSMLDDDNISYLFYCQLRWWLISNTKRLSLSWHLFNIQEPSSYKVRLLWLWFFVDKNYYTFKVNTGNGDFLL